jgi:D-sedoheptulose 7-phosphate isomerase
MMKIQNFENFFNDYNDRLQDVLKNLDKKKVFQLTKLLEDTIKKDKTIFVCGNGGSHAIANHYVCDYFKVLSQETNLKVKIKSLCSDNALISAISNDFSYDEIFLYQAERLMKKGDILILISSSGNSSNIKKVLDFANLNKIKTIGLCGFTGGYLKRKCTIPIYSKINNYGISEDVNHIIMHLVMQYIKIGNLTKNIKNPIL